MLAAPSSGSGKTVLTLALLRALRVGGIDIRAAKAGPDFIDPGFHAAACGHPSVNLDPWAMASPRLAQLAAGQRGSHLLVEAMMGLFDGAADGTGCAADLAQTLGLPVVLVVDAAKQSHSIAALVRGFRDHRPDLKMAGVILNKTGGARHEAMLVSALAAIDMPVFGAIPRSASLVLPERHLGLVQAGEMQEIEAFITAAANLISQCVNLDAFVSAFLPLENQKAAIRRVVPPGSRIAIARDAAFTFLYPHMLADWKAAGAELSFFSPLANEAPSRDADAIFLPGGYPELHGEQLAAAASFHQSMRLAASRGVAIHGECGGYMVLGDGIEVADGKRHAMCGLLRLETSFATRKLHLGYRRLTAQAGYFAGAQLMAHEFHYSTALREEGERLFQAKDALGTDLGWHGLRNGLVSGSYMHLIEAA